MGFFNGFALLAVEAGIKPVISNCDIKASGVGRVFDLERHNLVDKALSPMPGEIEFLAVKQVCIAVMCGGVSSGFHIHDRKSLYVLGRSVLTRSPISLFGIPACASALFLFASFRIRLSLI